jgi:hypothetical protein
LESAFGYYLMELFTGNMVYENSEGINDANFHINLTHPRTSGSLKAAYYSIIAVK